MPGSTATTPVATVSTGTGAPIGAPATGEAGVLTANVALVVVAGTALMVSPLKALPAFVVPLAPLMGLAIPPNMSLVATIGEESTFTVMVASLQFVGFSFSHNL